jgi:hypothetical protein
MIMVMHLAAQLCPLQVPRMHCHPLRNINQEDSHIHNTVRDSSAHLCSQAPGVLSVLYSPADAQSHKSNVWDLQGQSILQ